jgi:hypothetical protein
MSSRTTMPLPNVTTRAPSPSFVSTDEARDEPVMERADVAQRRPRVLGADVERDLLANRRHDGPPVD